MKTTQIKWSAMNSTMTKQYNVVYCNCRSNISFKHIDQMIPAFTWPQMVSKASVSTTLVAYDIFVTVLIFILGDTIKWIRFIS